MPDFVAHALDPVGARVEVAELKALLLRSLDLREAVFRDFFRARQNASVLIGHYNPGVQRVDLLAYEYPLFGDFRCDLAIGDSVTRATTFVELEDAGPRSLFVKRKSKATREWSPRFDHGYSQVVDWFHKLQDMTNSAAMEARFGKRAIDYAGVLVVGRNQHSDVGEHERLRWRREHVIVNSKRIVCVTYDQLLEDLEFRLDWFGPAAQAGGQPADPDFRATPCHGACRDDIDNGAASRAGEPPPAHPWNPASGRAAPPGRSGRIFPSYSPVRVAKACGYGNST
jgi:Domain of unknown function (DUF4263)